MTPSIESTFLAAIAILSILCSSNATKETAIPVNDVGEGSQCDQDQRVANVCLACSALPLDLNIPLVDCCSDEDKLDICKVCVDNPKSCLKMLGEVDSPTSDFYTGKVNGNAELLERLMMTSPQRSLSRQKRYGRLFMKSPNRNRRWFGKRDGSDMFEDNAFENDIDKRYGRLYIGGTGKYFGKRDNTEGALLGDSADDLYTNSDNLRVYGGIEDDDINLLDDILETPDKRYGRLYLGKGGYFGKFGKRYGDEDDAIALLDELSEIPEKRYGKVFLGNGGYFSKFGKRNEDYTDSLTNDIIDTPDKRYGPLYLGRGGYFNKFGSRSRNTPDKRYGRLFFGSGGGYYGKRDASLDMDKRYGRLFVGGGGYFGKRSPEDVPDEYNDDLTKRYGRLFMNSGGYFGKREEIDNSETEYDFSDNLLGSDDENDQSPLTADKRYGRLFMGGGFGRFLKNYRSG